MTFVSLQALERHTRGHPLLMCFCVTFQVVVMMVSTGAWSTGVGSKKVPTLTVAGAAVAPKPQHHREAAAAADDSDPLQSHMVLEKLHLPIHHNPNQEAEYVIRPLSEMPTPRQVYVAVIGIPSPKSAPPSPRLQF